MSVPDLNQVLLSLAATGVRLMPVHALIDGDCSCDRPGCPDPAKHPLTPNGVYDASRDLRVLTGWHAEAGGVENWAIATGPESDVWVLDIDPRHGGDDALAALVAEHGPLPETWTAATGGGGRHYYFRWPPGVTIPSRANVAPGVDVRGRGGYAICPPSVHASGGHYRWAVGPDAPLADAPGWLIALVVGPARLPAAAPASAAKPSAARPITVIQPVAPGTGLIVAAGSDDLTTCPGVGAGQRNARLCELVGRHLARDEGEEAVLELALAWGERCNPACNEAKLRDTVRRLAAKHGRSAQQHHPRDDDDDLGDQADAPAGAGERSIPPPGPPTPFLRSFAADGGWPVLHADAHHGLPGDILRTIAPETEADPAGVLLSLLTGIGVAVGRGPRFQVGADTHRANLFACVVGDTASGKGQCWGLARWLLERACPGWLAGGVSYGLSSGEGLIAAVADPPAAEGDDPDPAEPPERTLLAYETEFAKCIRAMRREGNTLSAVIRAAWDGATLESLTKLKAKASTAHIGVLANITPEELRKLLADSPDIANGFANRFCWALVRRQRLLPDGGDVRVLEPLVKPLADAVAAARAVRTPLRRSAEARDLWHAAYPVLKEARPGPYGLATERACPQAMRLALLYALLDKATDIRAAHLKAGLAVWRYCDASARLIFGDGTAGQGLNSTTASVVKEEPLAIRVLGLIQSSPGLSRTQMHESFGNRIKAGSLDEALAWLEEHDLAHRRAVSTGGRPAERWWPGPGQDGACERSISPPEPEGGPEDFVRSLVADDAEMTGDDPVVVEPERVVVTAERDCQPPLPLPELIALVSKIGGKFVNDNGVVAVEAEAPVPEAVMTAVAAHQDQLRVIIPQPPSDAGRASQGPSAEWQASYEKAQAEYQTELRRRRGDDEPPMTEEEFFGALNKIRPK